MCRVRTLLVHLTPDDALGADAAARVAAVGGPDSEAGGALEGLLARAIDAPERLRELFAAHGGPWVVGCRRPRAVAALLAFAGVSEDARARIAWVSLADPVRAGPSGPQQGPWYPVIDVARCRQCGQCAAYCLFGVYQTDAPATVRVQHPLNCKPGCPACARICPAVAVIFPLCPESPINGDPVTAGAPRVAVDLDAQLGPEALRTRARRRQVLNPERVAAALEAASGQPHDPAGVAGPQP